MLETALMITAVIALMASFAMLLMSKLNYFEKFRIRFGKEPCYFCHCFWICVIFYFPIMFLILFYRGGSGLTFLTYLTPFMATPITWYISVR